MRSGCTGGDAGSRSGRPGVAAGSGGLRRFRQDPLGGLDPAAGDLNANRYLAALIAFGRLAGEANEPGLAREAEAAAGRAAEALAGWWKRARARAGFA